MLRHILPNIAGLVIVLTTISLPAAIITESTLAFLLGVGSDVPSWGGELSGDSRRFFSRAPWIAIFPGAALSITVFAFNIFGDSIRDTLDPRLRGPHLAVSFTSNPLKRDPRTRYCARHSIC